MPVSGQVKHPFALSALAALYLFSLLQALNGYGTPFALMGRFYAGTAGHFLVLADGLLSLYILLGILKRQRLTVWLLIGYNLFDSVNACVNLALLPAAQFAQAAGAAVREEDLEMTTFAAALFLMLVNAYVFTKRKEFNNTSPYLF